MREIKEVDVLAAFSHPDDAELCVAGTLLKMKSLDYRTGVIDFTHGEMGTRGTPEQRADESIEAAKILGLDMRLNLDQPDGHVWLSEDSRCAMVRVIRSCKPKLILTSQLDDPHPDHANTSMIVRDAARLASMVNYDHENGQAAVKVPVVAQNVFSRNLVPSFVVDISDFLERKMEAIRAHRSQFFRAGSVEPATRISDPGFLGMLEVRSRYYGSLIGVAAGEPFFVREALNVDDPIALLTRPMNIYS